jgi:hypothetical protein
LVLLSSMDFANDVDNLSAAEETKITDAAPPSFTIEQKESGTNFTIIVCVIFKKNVQICHL